MTALNAILARQGQINPQSGVVGGQQGLPMGGGVTQSKPPGMQGGMISEFRPVGGLSGSSGGDGYDGGGIMDGQQFLPRYGSYGGGGMGGGVEMSPVGSLPQSSGPIARPEYAGRSVNNNPNSPMPNTPYVAANKRLQAPVGYNRDPRQNTQFNALSPQDQERYYQGGMNRASGMANPGQAVTGTAQGGDSPYENRINSLMTSQGMTREQAIRNQASAINQGTDLNNDGAVSSNEYRTFQNPIYENGINNLMTRQGMTRGQAIAHQASAVDQGADLNNDGTVSRREYQTFSDTPQTGLIGAEQALGIATSGLSEAGAQARRDLEAGYSGSQQNLESAYQGVGQAGDQARTDINTGVLNSGDLLRSGSQMIGQAGDQARSDINRGLYDSSQSLRSGSEMVGQAGSRSINDFLGGTQQGRQDINRSSQAALQPLSRFAQSGQDANALQANLLGANGPAAQAAAMQQFQDSPGQDFLREEQERAVLRNSAATGGTQGGAVLEELQRRAFGRAGTAFNDRISQLGGLGSQGLTASQGQAGIMSDAGRALSGLAERGSSNIANTRLGVAGQQADIQGDLSGLMERGAGNLATAGLNVAGQQSDIQGQLSGVTERGAGNLATAGLNVAGQQAGLQQAMGSLSERNASNLASTGLGIAGQLSGIQGTVAGGRTRAGEQIAQNIGSTTNNLANLQNAEGAALAQILDGGQFAEIMAKAGITDANTLQQLATLLANISTGQGSQATGLGGIPGVTQTEGALAGIGQAAAGAGAAMTGFAAMSDIRLKENIVPIGKIGQHNFYTWDWKAEALPIVGNQGTVGVIAQEAQKISPDAVFEVDGILKVDYSRIF